jgi:hypothetical protein
MVETSPNKDWGDYHAPCTMGYAQRRRAIFFGNDGQAKIASMHALGFKNHIVKGKLEAMKSHDYHVLTQQILPLWMRHKMTKEPQ